MTIDELITKMNAFRNQRGWKDLYTPRGTLLGLFSEAGELAEHFRGLKDQEVEAYIKTHKEEIGDEIVDTLYWLLIFSHDLNINIEDAFNRKMQKNAEKYPLPPEN